MSEMKKYLIPILITVLLMSVSALAQGVAIGHLQDVTQEVQGKYSWDALTKFYQAAMINPDTIDPMAKYGQTVNVYWRFGIKRSGYYTIKAAVYILDWRTNSWKIAKFDNGKKAKFYYPNVPLDGDGYYFLYSIDTYDAVVHMAFDSPGRHKIVGKIIKNGILKSKRVSYFDVY
jgi:hypothetical protein